MYKLISILLVVMFISGCVTSGKKMDTNQLSQIEKGVSTEADIEKIFGKPFSKTLTSEGKVISMYSYCRAKNRVENFIPVVGLVSGGMDMDMQTLSILFNTNGKVETYTFNDASNQINTGLLNQK